MPAAGRLTATSLNALNGAYGESNSSGYFATELRKAGYDHIIVRGRSNKPVYLWIDDDNVELRDAFSVHAMKLDDSGDALRLLQEHLGHASFNTTAKYGGCGKISTAYTKHVRRR